MQTAHAEVLIQAPIQQVWQVMLDLDGYPKWNPFTPRIDCKGPPRVGAPIRLHVRWADGKQVVSPERIVRLEPPAPDAEGRLRAVYGYNFGTLLATLNLIRSERLQILEAVDAGTTRYHTTIRLTGGLSSRVPIAKIQDGFDRQAAALKTYCERASA
jgi:hypothetical protein